MLRGFGASIQAKVIGMLLACLTLTLVVSNLISWGLLGRSLDDQTLFTAEHVIGPNQATVIQNLMPTGNTALVQQTLSRMVNKAVPEITVYRPDGQATFASVESKVHTMNTDPDLLGILAQKEPQIRWLKDKGERYLVSYSPVLATEVCATCHAGVKPGDVRGFIATRISLKHVDSLLFNQTALNTGISALLFAVVLGVLAFMVTRIVTRPLAEMTRAVEGIAAGNLAQHVPQGGRDEMGRMARSLQKMVDNLMAVIRGVRASAQMVDAGVNRIGASTETLARTQQSQAGVVVSATSSVEQMASSIEQVAGNADTLSTNVERTATAISQMVESIRTVAHNGQTLTETVDRTTQTIEGILSSIGQVAQAVDETTRMADSARSAASEGREAVTQTNSGMVRIDRCMREILASIEELNLRSSQIGDILELIQDIADQTNLLALNAAIEAARAGDAGRGFAVVADEVRKLSERTATATRSIAELVHAIRQETQAAISSTHEGNSAITEGASLAQRADSSLGAIVEAVNQTHAQMRRIAEAAHAQRSSAEAISAAVSAMRAVSDEVSQATREQASDCENVLRAVDTMTTLTQQVSVATREQRSGSRHVVELIETVNHAAQESTHATGQIAEAADQLQRQATDLVAAIATFGTGEEAPVVATATVPLALSGR